MEAQAEALKKLCDDYFAGMIDVRTYRHRRGELLDGLLGLAPRDGGDDDLAEDTRRIPKAAPLDAGDTQPKAAAAAAPAASPAVVSEPTVEGPNWRVIGGIAGGGVGVLLLLILLWPGDAVDGPDGEGTNTEITTTSGPPGVLLLEQLMETQQWNESTVSAFIFEWQQLTATEEAVARDSEQLKQLKSELRSRMQLEQSLGGAADTQSATQLVAETLSLTQFVVRKPAMTAQATPDEPTPVQIAQQAAQQTEPSKTPSNAAVKNDVRTSTSKPAAPAKAVSEQTSTPSSQLAAEAVNETIQETAQTSIESQAPPEPQAPPTVAETTPTVPDVVEPETSSGGQAAVATGAGVAVVEEQSAKNAPVAETTTDEEQAAAPVPEALVSDSSAETPDPAPSGSSNKADVVAQNGQVQWPSKEPCSSDRLNTRGARCWDMLAEDVEGPKLRVIPSGRYQMGDVDIANAMPVQQIHIERPFAVGIFEVSIGEYRRYCESSQLVTCPKPRWNGDEFPVVDVTWDQAMGYTQWLSQVTGAQYRLPTEAEWEYFARGGAQTTYPFGEKLRPTDARYDSGGGRLAPLPRVDRTTRSNGFRLGFVVGNVHEWTADAWRPKYDQAPQAEQRAVRGGSYADGPDALRSASRIARAVEYSDAMTGFRLVRDL